MNKWKIILALAVMAMLFVGGPILANQTTTETSADTDTTTVETTTQPEEETTTLEETTTVPETTEPPEETTVPEETEPPIYEQLYYFDETEKLIFATILRLECGGSSYETKMAVASVILNRMNYWALDLRQVVFAKNQFSPAHLINRETGYSKYNPSKDGIYKECWQVVEDICREGPSLPYYVMYFRAGHYHTWTTPYAKIGSLYFSYVPKYT